MEKFIAKTNVSLNVAMKSGGSVYVSFTPLTGGGSVFYTDDAELASAMKRHYRYGKLFKSAGGQCAVVKHEQPCEQHSGDSAVVIEVSEPDEAKEYLCEHFGLIPAKLKSLSAIKAAAKAHGVEFKGL